MFRLMVMNGLLICLKPKSYAFVPSISAEKDDMDIDNFNIIKPHHGNDHIINRNGNHTFSRARRGVDQKENGSNYPLRNLRSGSQLLFFSAGKLSWVDAQKDCKSRNGALAVLGEEPEDVFAFISENIGRKAFWVGGSDIETEGTWFWLNGDPIDPTKYWRRGEPNGGESDDCLYLYRGIYYDRSCKREYQYICDLESDANIPFHERTQYLSFSDERVSWEDAIAGCEAKHGTLAILEDEPDDVVAHIASHYAGIAFWLGGSDIATEGNWTWLNGNPINLTKFWRRNEPNNWWGGEDCLEYYYGYNDRSCGRRARYICDLDNIGTCNNVWIQKERSNQRMNGECYVYMGSNNNIVNPPLVIEELRDGTEQVAFKRWVPHGTKVTFACSGKQNIENDFKSNRLKGSHSVTLYCFNGILFNDCSLQTTFTLDELDCVRSITPEVFPYLPNNFGSCGVGGKLYKIGYLLKTDQIFPLISVCFNHDFETTIWTEHTIHGKNINWRESYDAAGFTVDNRFFSVPLTTIYPASSQLQLFGEKLNRADILYAFGELDLYLVRGHMAAKADFVTPAEQDATFSYLNALPQWQTINNPITKGNWGKIEEFIRGLASCLQYDLKIYSGGYETMAQISLNTKTPIPIFLGSVNSGPNKIPVPAVTWKVVIWEAAQKAVAFVVINNPHPHVSPINKLKYSSRCEELKWLYIKKHRLDNHILGETYCFTVREFRGVVKGSGLPPLGKAEYNLLDSNLNDLYDIEE